MPILKPREDYTVGWICTLPIEVAAAEEVLDSLHVKVREGETLYTLGQIGEHNVVISGLPAGQIGTVSAAVLGERMVRTFPSIRIGLMVGIGGGVPSRDSDIRLGDVVISQPRGIHGGVVQYDLGKKKPDEFERTGHLKTPPTLLLNALTNQQANYIRGLGEISELVKQFDHLPSFARNAAGPDQLFKADHKHRGGSDCTYCDRDELIPREPRSAEVKVHYGTIASGNCVMRDGVDRDRVSAELGGVLCFEMEAAGLMNNFPCLVIRGICDYADSHKNKEWQPYAASTAAACSKEILSLIPADEVTTMRNANLALAEKEFIPLLYQNTCLYEESKNRNRRHVEGTCEWFIHHELFKQWSSDRLESRLLYVTADPGCGKSVLSRHLVDNVLPRSGRIICFFFFKEDADNQRTSRSALCSMLHQIFTCNRNLLSGTILQRYLDRGHRLMESFELLWEIFLLAIDHQQVICLLEALDECVDMSRIELVGAITELCHRYTNSHDERQNVKFLITSRPYEYIRAHMFQQPHEVAQLIHLQGDQGPTADAIAKEIQLVLNDRIEQTAMFFCLEPREKELMETQLGSIPNRSYLWITLIFDGLMERRLGITKADILEILRKPPHSVHDTYERILNKSPDVEGAKRLLQIIVGAKRPLSLAEISVALAFKKHQSPEAFTDDIIPASRIKVYVRNLCGLFTIVIADRVYLLHQTAREFLTTVSSTTEPHKANSDPGQIFTHEDARFHFWRGSICTVQANDLLVDICAPYLLSQALSDNPSMVNYAALYWTQHYRQSSEAQQVAMLRTVKDLCAPEKAQLCWADAFFNQTGVPLSQDSSLCNASLLGLDRIVEELLAEMRPSTGMHYWSKLGLNRLVSQSKKGSPRQTSIQRSPNHEDRVHEIHEALFCASRTGEQRIVELLMRLGRADINAKCGLGRTALSFASQGGFDSLVKFLLQNGGQVHLQDNKRRTPLSYASKGGFPSIVELLLQHGSNVKSADISGMTPLMYAIERGFESIVELLLEGGSDINSRDENGRTPLIYASKLGFKSIVELLLQRGGDIRLRGRNGTTPLICATEGGFKSIVELLVQSGSNINTRDNHGMSPLMYASKLGFKSIVELLLESGSDINSRNDNAMTPLWLATKAANAAIVRLLVESGRPDVNAQAKGQSPLALAAFQGHEATLKALLEAPSIDVELRNEQGMSPLHCAAAMGHQNIVSILLETGRAKIDPKDKYGRTPLSDSARNGHAETVELLLETGGVDINWSDEYYGRTALSYAAANGHVAVTKVLFKAGNADVNLSDEYCRSPLSYAVENGHILIVTLLLNTGQIDKSQIDVYGRSPLEYATEDKHKEIASQLQLYFQAT